MAKSRFEYVKSFEQDDSLLKGCYIVVRVDGRGFSKFTNDHNYNKPNDIRGLSLMNQAAADVMRDWGETILAFGESDEYSFVFPRASTIFGRRSSKLSTGIASLFAASFVFHWSKFFPNEAMKYPPAFDARCVCYPTLTSVMDYFKWRQVDTHINTLHNEAFWALVLKGNRTPNEAYDTLKGTLSDTKNEILFTQFGINYAKLPEIYRRGTTLYRAKAEKYGGTGKSSADTENAEVQTASRSKTTEHFTETSSTDYTKCWLTEGHPPLPPLVLPRNVLLIHPDYLEAKSTFLHDVFAPHEL